MEAYRRLASVTSETDVDDIRDEWQDRYGPPPPPAAALLDVARLRAECIRLGVRSVAVQKGMVRLDGLHLRKSQEVRLQRLVPKAQFLPDAVVLPMVARADSSITQALLALLGEIAPAEAAPVPSAG
jgi:transcription-repair coupling factor (superfamily II helicase)